MSRWTAATMSIERLTGTGLAKSGDVSLTGDPQAASGAGQRNHLVDALRAFAALSVCLFHFTAGAGVAAFGYLGVTIFFVVSGFIVPLSMKRGGYVIRAWPRFMLKRLVRLEPPYLASIVLILVFGVWDSAHGAAPIWTFAQVVGHLGYANAFLGLPWLNSVYWSLAIEFQFYLVIGLTLPLLLCGTSMSRLIGILTCAALPLLQPGTNNQTIIPFLPVFAIGILCFLHDARLIERWSFWPTLVILAAIVFEKHDARVALVSAGTAVLICTVAARPVGPIAWLASISYSLYLVHGPIGYRLTSVLSRPSVSVVGIAPEATLIALAVSLAAAALLHRLVERPSHQLAARIKYHRPSCGP